MRKAIMVMLLVLGNINLITTIMIKVNADNHNHQEFESLTPYNYRRVFLDQISQDEIKNTHKSIKRKLFGWKIKPITRQEEITYTGITVFSKHNNTSNRIDFTYNYETVEKTTTSTKLSGTLSNSVTAKIEGIGLGVDNAIRSEIGKEVVKTISESTKILIIIDPYTSLTIRTKGTAILNNGVGHFYFLGARLHKFEWEYVDVKTEYYEYYEESLI